MIDDDDEYGPAPEDTVVQRPELDHTIFYSKSEDAWMGKDEHGQFRLQAGAREPPSEHLEDYDYEPCGATLKHSYERYGEKRYCEALAVSNFHKNGKDMSDNYEYPQHCRRHQGHGAIMEQHEESVKHMAFVESYENLFDYFSAHEKFVAVETFSSLLDESKYDFEPEDEPLVVEADDTDVFDPETVELTFPVPQEHVARAKALWFATLEYIRIENVFEEQFRVAAEETGPDGEDLTVGEKSTVVTVTDDGRVIEEKGEHHLNLPLSRIQKDYESHLDFGGVEHTADEESDDDDARTWVLKAEEPTEGASTGDNPADKFDAD